MTHILAPLMPEYTLQIPQDFLSLVGWVFWLGLLVFLTLRYRDQGRKFDRRSLIWLAVLSVLVLLLTPFLGFPVGQVHLMVFAALPWMLAGGVLGLVPAVMLAAVSGLLLAYLDTHSIFTPLLFMTTALIFTLSIRQRYRTRGYRLLRFPLTAALVVDLVLAPVTFGALLLDSSGALTDRVLDALLRFRGEYLALAGMILIGGTVGVLARILIGENWGPQGDLQPAPGEQNLVVRFTLTALPIALAVLGLVVALQWRSAEAGARRTIVQQMTHTSDLVAEGLPAFISTEADLLQGMAEEGRLRSVAPEALPNALATLASSFPYFDQLAFFNSEGVLVAAYPPESAVSFELTEADRPFFQQALGGTESAPVVLTSTVQVSLLTGVRNPEGEARGVLWGQTRLENPALMQPYMAALADLAEDGGSGQIIRKDGLILYHTDPGQVGRQYLGAAFTTPTFYESDASDQGRSLEYYQPAGDLGWAVVTSMPVAVIQTVALELVLPTFLSGLAMIVVVLLMANLILGRVQQDAREIATAAEKITQGEWGVSLPKRRYSGEMNRLAGAFQQMLGTVRTKMQKQSELLSVSERITGQLKLQDSLQVVLLAAVEHGVSSARVVVMADPQQKGRLTPDQQFGRGKHTQALAPLDEDVLRLSQSRGQFVMRDTQIIKQFHIAKGMPYPGMMIAMPLRWKSTPLGVFWVAYDDRTTIGEDEFAYFNDLAHKAATAIINTKAFDESLTTRKRLESVLTQLPDPVFLADDKGQVIYLNDAAGALPGVGGQKALGAPFRGLFVDEDLRAWATVPDAQPQSKEISFADGKAYQVTIAPLMVDGRRVGQAGVFRDISQFKQRDNLKTEFVTTASHELRSPLTLILGYAKILRLTGNLNEQQDTYVGNIIDGVEEMKSLVQNLLDLGRLDAGDALDWEEVAVGEVMNKVMASMGAHAKQKNIEVHLDLPEEPLFIEADPTFLTQALKNLVDNAIRYSKSGRHVEIRVRQQTDSVVFAVQDEGPGIAPLDQRKIFKRFFRSDGRADLGQGSRSGLGLAIVQSIAERHGGKVWFESKLGQGSTFYLQIPTAQPK